MNKRAEELLKRAIPFIQKIFDEGGRKDLELGGDLIDKIADYFVESSEDARIELAQNLNTPQEVLTELSQDKNVNIRCAVAANLNTPQEILTILSTDKDAPVRYNVLVNSATSADTCATIRDFDECSVIVYIAAKQCNLTLYEYTNKEWIRKN